MVGTPMESSTCESGLNTQHFSLSNSEKGTLRFPFVASNMFDPVAVTKWSPSHRGTHEYSVRVMSCASVIAERLQRIDAGGSEGRAGACEDGYGEEDCKRASEDDGVIGFDAEEL